MASPEIIDKKTRKRCYHFKDIYIHCLQENCGTEQLCVKPEEDFLAACPKKWVEYFKKREEFNNFRKAQDATGYIRKSSS